MFDIYHWMFSCLLAVILRSIYQNEIPKQTARQHCIYILFCQKSNLEDNSNQSSVAEAVVLQAEELQGAVLSSAGSLLVFSYIAKGSV